MKIHLPISITICLALEFSIASATFVHAAELQADENENRELSYTIHQYGPLNLSNYVSLHFENIQYMGRGAAIYNFSENTSYLTKNTNITFSGNMAPSRYASYDGVICNVGVFTIGENENVTFSENTASFNYNSSNSYGGAIYNWGAFAQNGNGVVTFCRNTASYGGAIFNCGNGYFTLSNNEAVAFNENKAFASGGAIYNEGKDSFYLSGNGAITFNGNNASLGGAFSNKGNGTFSLDGNGDVLFSRNAATSGGAIYNEGKSLFSLRANDDVTFSGNTASSGASIYNVGNSYFSLSNNGEVAFNENTAFASGGAIYNEGAFMLSDNDNVAFCGNSVTHGGRYGGAIFNGYNGTFAMSGNGDVLFSKNAASLGGAIYNEGSFSLNNNDSVTFRENTDSCAIHNYGSLLLIGNEDVTFCENAGGAIYNQGTCFLSNNGIVTFSKSTADFGGAFYNDGTLTLSGNDSVTFSGNTAKSFGGSICNNGILELSENENVTFSGNVTCARDSGAAIYNFGTFTIRCNGDVFFEKNAETNGEIYCLRSIYSVSTLNLAALENKRIIFHDSVYAKGTVNWNNEGTGDIIFTGATTESDLREVKGGVDGTAEEILNSRTSEIATNATLYGGRLIVEDEAILKVNGLSVADGASVVVKDGTLSLMNGNATITTADGGEKAVMVGASLGASSLAGMDAEHRGSVEGAHIDLAEGAEFSLQHLVLGATTRITDAPATLQLDDVTAELVMGVNASLTGSDMLMAGTMLTAGGRTLTLEENTGVVMLESTVFDSVTLRGDTLVLELAGMTLEMLNGAEYIAVSFTSGGAYASYDSSLAVTLTADGIHFTEGYALSSDGGTSTMRYFHAEKAGVTPEPATTALSMLALAGLAARRRRKGTDL